MIADLLGWEFVTLALDMFFYCYASRSAVRLHPSSVSVCLVSLQL